MTGFRLNRMSELYRQLMLSPADVRRAHADRLEQLLLALDPDREYPYEFIYFRITGFRPQEDYLDTYPGAEVLPDLHRALERLSRSVPKDVSVLEEKVYSAEELARAFNVSTRTVHRWRRRGLAARTYLFPDGRKRIGVPQKALDSFVERNRDAVQWSRQFTKLMRAEEKRIIALARRYARSEGLSRTAAASRVAEELGRARETVRLVLMRHDRDHPDEAIYDRPPVRFEQETRGRIYADHQQGARAEALSRRYHRSRSSIYRIINQEKAAEILREPLTYHYEETFRAEDAEQQILGEDLRSLLRRLGEAPGPPAAGVPSATRQTPSGLRGGNVSGIARWRQSPLSKAEEAALFGAYNYAKFRICELRRGLNPKRYVASQLIKRINELMALAGKTKDCLMRVHLPLADQVARQHAGDPSALDELTTEGRRQLSSLVESFDYRGRGRFPGHATLQLFKWFARDKAGEADDESGPAGP